MLPEVVAPSVEVVAGRLAEVRQRIEAAGASPDTVRIVAVTKTFPVDFLTVAVAAGLDDIGENYAQELVAKDDQLADRGIAPRWHFIGGLQRNKVKLLAGRVDLWQTVDRVALLGEIAKRDPGAEILIQVNTTAEDQKSGCDPDQVTALVGRGRELDLKVLGLMTVGPTGGGDPRPSFDRLRALAADCEVSELSMGMTADYEQAVACGSTMIRIGSALFGPRNRPGRSER
jgi:pyridoxal phosphate enzyme (YggS family)